MSSLTKYGDVVYFQDYTDGCYRTRTADLECREFFLSTDPSFASSFARLSSYGPSNGGGATLRFGGALQRDSRSLLITLGRGPTTRSKGTTASDEELYVWELFLEEDVSVLVTRTVTYHHPYGRVVTLNREVTLRNPEPSDDEYWSNEDLSD